MTRKVWVVSAFSIIAGVYSTEDLARNRASALGDAEISAFMIDEDTPLKMQKTERLGSANSEAAQRLSKIFDDAERTFKDLE